MSKIDYTGAWVATIDESGPIDPEAAARGVFRRGRYDNGDLCWVEACDYCGHDLTGSRDDDIEEGRRAKVEDLEVVCGHCQHRHPIFWPAI